MTMSPSRESRGPQGAGFIGTRPTIFRSPTPQRLVVTFVEWDAFACPPLNHLQWGCAIDCCDIYHIIHVEVVKVVEVILGINVFGSNVCNLGVSAYSPWAPANAPPWRRDADGEATLGPLEEGKKIRGGGGITSLPCPRAPVVSFGGRSGKPAP